MDRPKQLSNPTEYSVGFITALANELTAVEAMLDEEHGSPLNFIQHERDDNCYTWGRMGVHNVVIASLPEGRYGLVSAATTAYSLLSSLPHLRIGLMVGIGAGIPKLQTNIDIRLGDVVVSQPTDQSSGVFQYDLGKKRQDGTFQHVGSLAPPPTVLLTGLQKLKAKRRRKGSELPYILEEMLRRSPKLAEPDDDDPAFVYQGSHNDRLFESSVPHVEMTAEKNTAAGLSKSTQTPSVENRNAEEAGLETGNCVLCDRAGEVTRKERRSTDPVVHYGIIASGNSVMKNSLCRDEISRQIDDKCICFEMEAAGLMNTFPCLVIRGICDYADSHKNNRWQNYAAATAATFSKELLHVIDAVVVSKSPNMKQIVDRMLENISQLTSDAKEANQGLQQLNDNKLSENIKNWLSPCDLWETHNSTLERRQDGTGNWFLDSDSYASWKENSKFSVWVHGKPGCGKTTLCSTIIDDVMHGSMHRSRPLVFFYFAVTDNRRKSLDGAIRSLIGQLCSQSEDAWTELKSLYSSHKNGGRQPSTRSLCKASESMVLCTGEVWMVLDALDECEAGMGLTSQGVMPWVKGLLESPLSIRLLLTCRGEHKTQLYLEGSTNSRMNLGGELVRKDIRAYVHETLSTRETFKRWRRKGYESIQREIEDSLVAKANGVFRWVALQLYALQHCQDPATLRRELNALPDDLANTYAAILKRIPKRSEEQSIRILQFLAFSERPLRVKEAVDLLAVELKEKPGFNPNNRMPIPEEITGYCSGLVVIGYTDEHRGDMEIQLAHATVKEYLISDRLSQDVSAHFATSVAKAATSITEVCLAYLSEVKLVSPPNIEDLNFYKDKDAVYYLNVWPPWYHYKPFRGVALDGFIKMRYPFAQYAADYWMRHAFHANTSQVETQVKKFIDCEIFHRLYEHSAENSSALYRMAQEGLTWAIELLLEKDATLLNAREDESLLAAAIQHRHDNTFHVLLARGAKVDRTAIVCASSRGDEELVRPLIGKVTAANAWKWCSKAAMAACAEGHVEILHMILEKCEEANIMCCIEGEWICDAFKGGHNAVVMALLDSPPHATFYAQSWRSACENGLCGLVEILLAKDTDADAAGRRTEALSIATDKGHVEIVKLLLKNGVGIGKAVFFAAIGNREEILKLLLENGGSPNTTHRSETALQAAYYRGHKNIVQILLEFGASDKDLFGPLGSAFQSAVRGGNLKIAELLVEYGEARSGFDIRGVPEKRLIEGQLARLRRKRRRTNSWIYGLRRPRDIKISR